MFLGAADLLCELQGVILEHSFSAVPQLPSLNSDEGSEEGQEEPCFLEAVCILGGASAALCIQRLISAGTSAVPAEEGMGAGAGHVLSGGLWRAGAHVSLPGA